MSGESLTQMCRVAWVAFWSGLQTMPAMFCMPTTHGPITKESHMIDWKAVERRARELCSEVGIDPDSVRMDDAGRELPRWKDREEKALAELRSKSLDELSAESQRLGLYKQ
jgi:hypothetical protein